MIAGRRASQVPCARHGTQRGLTLVETAVTVAIGALLAMLGASFASTWTHNAQVSQAQTAIQHAYSAAKALALQNPNRQTMNGAAAVLCFTSGAVAVYPGSACNGTASWQASIPAGVSVLFGSPTYTVAPSCIALDNAGAPTNSATSCTTALTYKISKESAYALSSTLY